MEMDKDPRDLFFNPQWSWVPERPRAPKVTAGSAGRWTNNRGGKKRITITESRITESRDWQLAGPWTVGSREVSGYTITICDMPCGYTHLHIDDKCALNWNYSEPWFISSFESKKVLFRLPYSNVAVAAKQYHINYKAGIVFYYSENKYFWFSFKIGVKWRINGLFVHVKNSAARKLRF